MASKTFDPPFANAGDKTAVPDPTQPAGAVSYTEGFPIEYELDQVTEPTARDVPRQETNQLWFDVTEFLQEIQQNGLAIYNATYNYLVGAHTIGSDGLLYRALLVNGPASTVRNPVGDVSGTWLVNNGGAADVIVTTVFTASDPTWAPNALTRNIRVTVTGGGGGGGGVSGVAGGATGVGSSGSAGATGIKTINAPIDATYAVVVGAGGAGGDGPTGAGGFGGAFSSFDGASVPIITATGGGAGPGDGSTTAGNAGRVGVAGGTASNGDLNIGGGDSGRMQIIGGVIAQDSRSGASYWGGGGAIELGSHDSSDGNPGVAYGSGGAGGVTIGVTDHDGGAGAPGVVVVEEYF